MNEHLSLLVEPVDVPSEGPERARRAGTGRLRRRRVVGSVGALLAIVVLAVLVLPDRGGERVTTDPATTVAPDRAVLGPPLLDLPTAALDAQPVIPEGWKSVDYGLGRVWVPAGWEVMSSDRWAQCPLVRGPVVVVLGQQYTDCGAFAAHVTLGIGLQGIEPSETVNGLGVTRQGSLDCATCSRSFSVGQLSLSISGNVAELDQVVSTVGPSPVARVLADGPLVSTDGWQRAFAAEPASTTGTTNPGPLGGIALWAPGDWPVRALGQRDANPGSCAEPVFSGVPTVMLGNGGLILYCPTPFTTPHPPSVADGVWLPDTNGGVVTDVAAVIGGNGRSFQVGAGPDVVSLNFFTRTGSQAVVVGIGPDPAVARTILRTLSLG